MFRVGSYSPPARAALFLIIAVCCADLVLSQLSEVQVTHPLTPIKADSFYDPTTCPTHWGADDWFGPPSGVDGDSSTFIHTSVWDMARHQYIVDNEEIRAITRVRLQARPDCCWERDSPVQVWVGNNPTDATAPGNVMCVMAPPFTGLGTWREFTCTRASFLARYVFLLLDCSGATPCIMNWAGVVVYALQPSWPLVYREVAQGKPADMITSCCSSPTTAVATWAVDGGTKTITHTGGAPQGVLWWQVDLGSFTQPIDRVWLLARPHYINCIRYFQRDQGQDIAVSNSSSDLAFDGATPAANLCGTTDDPFVAPWNWHQVGCGPRLGRYVWVRGVKAFTNVICNLAKTSCWSGENYIQFTEVRVYSSTCPSMRAMLTPSDASYVTFTDAFSSGCGPSGARNSVYAWTGSRCMQACAPTFVRLRGGASGVTSECRLGEWVDVSTRAAAGPLVCGTMCPAISVSTLHDGAACVQTVARLDFNSGSGTMADWWPTWKVFRATSVAAAAAISDLGNVMSYPEMEARARFSSGGLWLVGARTLWALNNPAWADAAQLSASLSITADIILDTPTTVAGLAVRVVDGPVASFYLLRLRWGADSHRFYRVDAGVETDLGGTRTGVCNILTNAARQVKLAHAGSTLTATCDGVLLGIVSDSSANRLLRGSAGLWNDRGPDFSPSSQASILTFYDNVLVERSCDGPDGGCSASLPGEQCTLACNGGTSKPVAGTSGTVSCNSDGTWNAAPLQCAPNVDPSSAGPFRVNENSPDRSNVGNAITIAPLPSGATLNFTLLGSTPAGAPFSIGLCDGQFKVARPGGVPALDFEAGPRTYSLTLAVGLTIPGAGVSTTVHSVTVDVIDVPEAPYLPASSTVSVPEDASVGASFGGIQCMDVDGPPWTANIAVNAPGGLFTITRTFPAASTMPNAGAFSLILARGGVLDAEGVNAYTLVISCSDATGLSGSGVVIVSIADVPEPPVFFASSLNVSIEENATALMTAKPALQAWDPENSTLIYALADGFTSPFFTVSSLGTVVYKAGAPPLDYENRTQWPIPLRVKVTDASGLTNTATCFVMLNDVNEAPVLPNQTRVVREDALAFSEIGAPLIASDPEDNGLLRYYIWSQPRAGLFTVDSPSGQLRLGNTLPGQPGVNQLDFFARSSFVLQMGIADAGTPDGRPTIVNGSTVNITVQWVNQPPSSPNATQPCAVAELAAGGAAVCTASATDRDARPPINDFLRYSIAAQEATPAGDAAPFTINAVSGAVTVTAGARLDFVAKRTYAVTVAVSDSSGASASAAFTVRLSNVNQAPSLPSGLTFPARSRTAGLIGTALSALVIDPDIAAGVGERFTFAIVGGNTDSALQMDPNTGQISVANAAAPSFFTGTTYALQVRVTDAGIDGAALSAVATISIPVIDSNQAPDCSAVAGRVLVVAERSMSGTDLGTLACTDPDLPNQSLSYRIDASGPNANRPFPFRITAAASNAGRILVDTTAVGLDFEAAPPSTYRIYNATVTATDSHPTFPLSASAGIVIMLTDAQEAPFFFADPDAANLGNPGVPGRGEFNLTLPENSISGTSLTGPALRARDQDAADGFGSLLTYSWAPATAAADSALFAVNASTGVVTVAPGLATPAAAASVLDFETKRSYRLWVQARDTAGNTDTAVVNIELTDVNERPLLRSPPYAAAGTLIPFAGPLTVAEDAPVGTHVGSLRAYDVDAGLSGYITFAINGSTDACTVRGTSIFAINPANGTISVVRNGGAIDWEDCTSYTLSVTVTDGGVALPGGIIVSPLISVFMVPITVIDAPDAVISNIRLAGGQEAAGLGVDLQDQFSPLASQYAAGPGVGALLATAGGARLVFTGTGFGPTPNRIAREGAVALAVSATFGPPSAVSRFNATACSVTAAGTTIACTAGAGTGAGHVWAITINGQTFRSDTVLPDASMAVLAAGASASYKMTSFLPPALVAVDKVGSSAPGGNQLLSTRGGDLILIRALQAGPVGTSVTLTYGTVADKAAAKPAFAAGAQRFTAGPCTWLPASPGSLPSAGSNLTCPAAAGVGKDFGFQLSVDGQDSPVFAATGVAYAPPAVTSVASAGPFDTRGGEAFNISGNDFGPVGTTVVVRYSMGYLPPSLVAAVAAAGGRRPASNLLPVYTALQCAVVVPHAMIACRAGEGVGSQLHIMVTVASQTSSPVVGASIAYRPLVILGVGGVGAAGASTQGGAQVLLTVDYAGPATAVDAGGVPTDGPALEGYSLPLAAYGPRPAGAAGYATPALNQLAGALGNATVAASGLRYRAVGCVVTVAHTTIACTLSEGVGADLPWVAVIGGQASPISPNTSSYAPPTLAYFNGVGATEAATAGYDVVELIGANFGPLGTPVDSATYGKAATANAAATVTAGGAVAGASSNTSTAAAAAGEFTAINCSVVAAHTRVRCLVAPGAGAGHSWSLVIASQRSVMPTTKYKPPVITDLTGPGTVDASTEGGQDVFINGTDLAWGDYLEAVTFGPSGSEYTAADCRVTAPHRQIACKTPPGTGRRMQWQVTVYGQRSGLSAKTTSYEKPRITAVQPSPAAGSTAGGAIVTLSGTGFALRSSRSQLQIYMATGYAPASGAPADPTLKPAAADLARYWSAVQAGLPPPSDVRDAVQAWLASMTRPAVLSSIPSSGSITFALPPGYGAGREIFVTVDGIPSDVAAISYSLPVAENAAIDRRATPAGQALLIVDGGSFCRDATCGTLKVNGTAVRALNWTHTQITALISVPESGIRTPVVVSVAGRDSLPVYFSNPAPVFPSGIGEQREFTSMSTEGGQPVIVDGVTELAMVPDDSIAIEIGRSRNLTCTNITKTLMGGGDPRDPATRWRLTGLSPEGVGSQLPIFVRVGTARSPESPWVTFSYAPPSLISLAPQVALPPSARALQSGGVQSASWGVAGESGVPCAGARVVLTGVNLGSSRVSSAFVIVDFGPSAAAAAAAAAGSSAASGLGIGAMPGTSGSGSVSADFPQAARMAGPVAVVSHTHRSITLDLPAGQGVGMSLYLEVGGQISRTPLALGYAAPAISRVSPASGPTAGGTVLTIEGTNWGITASPLVTVGGVQCVVAPGYNATPSAPNSTLQCVLAPGVGADLPVVITVGGQASPVTSSAQRFSYRVPSVVALSPANGPTSGRQDPTEVVSRDGTVSYIPGNRLVVNLTGSDLGGPSTLPLTSIEFVSSMLGAPVVLAVVNASDMLSKDHTHIAFLMPEGAGSDICVRITVAGQRSLPSPGCAFTYDPPRISAWRRADRPPSACAPFNRCLDVPAARVVPLLSSNGTLAALLASSAADGGPIDSVAASLGAAPRPPPAFEVAPGVTVARSTARDPITNSSQYTVCRVAPAGCYETRGGYALEIRGSSFGGTALLALGLLPRVTIGGLPCPLTDVSPSSVQHERLVCMVPAGMGDAQAIVVSVLGRSSSWADGSSGSNGAPSASSPASVVPGHLFSYDPPELGSVMPSTPDATGDARITLRGRNFGLTAADLAVAIGGSVCDDPQWLSDNLISCMMPPGTVGPKNVSLLAANRTTPVVVFDFELAAPVAECRRNFYGLIGEHCLACPYAGKCPGSEQDIDLMTSDAGAWRTNVTLGDEKCELEHLTSAMRAPFGCPVVLACEPTEACLGDNKCAVGYEGERCKDCLRGKYYRVDGRCIRCPDSLVAIIIIVGLLLMAAAGLAYFFNKKNLSVSIISIGIDWAQVVALFSRSRIRWPEEIRAIFRLLSAFNLNLEIVAPECLNPDLRYWQKWLGIEALPLVFCSMFALVIAVKLLYKWACLNKSKEQLWAHMPGLISTGIVIFRVLYLYLTRTSMDVLSCIPPTPPDGRTYMLGDLNLPCWTKADGPAGDQLRLFPAALFTLACYSIALPLLALWWMRRNRLIIVYDQLLRCRGVGNAKLENPYYRFRRTFSKLYSAFKPARYLWEIVIVGRKAMLAAVSLVFRNSASYQLSMALLVLFAAFVSHSHALPYLSHSAKPAVLEAHHRAVLTDPQAAKIDAEMRAYEAKNTRRGYRSARVFVDIRAVVRSRVDLLALSIVDANTVEGVMLVSAILISLAGIMLDSARFYGPTAEFYKNELAGLTYATIIVLVATICYWFLSLLTDIMIAVSPETAARMCVCGSALARLGGRTRAGAGKAAGVTGAGAGGRRGNSAAALGSALGSLDGSTSGGVEMSISPLMSGLGPGSSGNVAAGGAGGAGASSGGGAGRPLSAADLEGIEGAPDELAWMRIKASYGALCGLVDELQTQNKLLQRQLASTEAAGDAAPAQGGGKTDRSRRQFGPVLAAFDESSASAGGLNAAFAAAKATPRGGGMSAVSPLTGAGASDGSSSAARSMAVFKGSGLHMRSLRAGTTKTPRARPAIVVDDDDDDKDADEEGGTAKARADPESSAEESEDEAERSASSSRAGSSRPGAGTKLSAGLGLGSERRLVAIAAVRAPSASTDESDGLPSASTQVANPLAAARKAAAMPSGTSS